MNTNTKPGERPQVLGPSELVQALREKHAGGWRLSYRAAMRVVQEQYDFRRAAALSSPHPEALEEGDLAADEARVWQALNVGKGMAEALKLSGDSYSAGDWEDTKAGYGRLLESFRSRLAAPEPRPEAREEDIEAIRKAIMSEFVHTHDPTPDGQDVDGEWYAPKWGCDTLDHIINNVKALSRLAALKPEAREEDIRLLRGLYCDASNGQYRKEDGKRFDAVLSRLAAPKPEGQDARLVEALSLLGELMSYDNFEAYPPYVQDRVRGFVLAEEAAAPAPGTKGEA